MESPDPSPVFWRDTLALMLGEPPSGLLMIIFARPVPPDPPPLESDFLSPLLPPDTETLAFASLSDFSRLYSPLCDEELCLEELMFGAPPEGAFPDPLPGVDPEELPPPCGPISQPSSPTPPTLFSLSMTAVREGFLLRLGDFPLALGLFELFWLFAPLPELPLLLPLLLPLPPPPLPPPLPPY